MKSIDKSDTIKEGLTELLYDIREHIETNNHFELDMQYLSLRLESYINLLERMCCDTCEYQDNNCPVKTADPWSRYGNYCNEYRIKVDN